MKLPNGSTFSLVTTLAASTAVSAITNATPAVATAAAGHGFVAGDFGLLMCGWSNLDSQVIKAGTVSSNDIPLVGVDTTSTVRFPAGGGVGTLQELSAYTQITGIGDFNTSGGEQQYLEKQFLEADTIESMPTVRSSYKLALVLADDTTKPWYAPLKKNSDEKTLSVFRLQFRDGSMVFYVGYPSLAPAPDIKVNDMVAIKLDIAVKAAGVSRF